METVTRTDTNAEMDTDRDMKLGKFAKYLIRATVSVAMDGLPLS
jgi:hypothetical protein